MTLRIDCDRVQNELETLASFSDAPAPAVTRIVFTETDMRARHWLKGLCREAGLEVSEDAVGNTFARCNGSEPDMGAVGTGSHIDAIPASGKYDGTVGVLGGLEAIRILQSSGFRPRRPIELLIFTAEEPTRFGIGCLGSRILSGTLEGVAADSLRDRNGRSLAEVRVEAGFTGGLDDAKLRRGHYSAFVELHIEQGSILEREKISLGIVTNIAAPASLRIQIEGQGGHAGAVLMPDRRDAFLAGAEVALAVEAAALSTGFKDTVATTGVCELFPGAVNSIPSLVKLELDIRDTDLERRDSVLRAIAEACSRVEKARRVSIRTELLNADAPAVCDGNIVNVLAEIAEQEGFRSLRMVSRAYHDSLFLSRICPVGMLFIPCRGGVSHRPDEYASFEDIATGIQVLAKTLARLAA